MANFYTDNEDIQFLFKHMDIGRLSAITEEKFVFAKQFDFAPENAVDAVDNYDRILNSVGEIAGDIVAPFSLKLILARVEKMGVPLFAVFGNNDGERHGLATWYHPTLSGSLSLLCGRHHDA